MNKKQKPAMLVIAESACGPQEIRKILTVEAERLLSNNSKRFAPSREWLIQELNTFLDRHYYADFQRRKSVMAVAKRAYTRWKYARYKAWMATRCSYSLPSSQESQSRGTSSIEDDRPRSDSQPGRRHRPK